MSVYDIGDYRVQQLNNGQKVSWQEGSIRHHLDLNLEQMIRSHIESHLNTIVRLMNLLETGPVDLLNDPIGSQIIQFLPDQDFIPGMRFANETERKLWDRQQLLNGYNRVNGTSFTWEMIRDRL